MSGEEPNCEKGREAGREEGTVKWFDAVRGYGFIARDGAVDLFVHGSEVPAGEAPLAAGERVSFVVADAPRGLLARQVRRAG